MAELVQGVIMIFREIVVVETDGGMHVQDVTERITKIVGACHIKEGLCNIFLPATTAGLMVNEHDRMLMEDFKRFFKTIEEKRLYAHPSNAFSHLRANLLSCERTIPISNGKLILGTWQRIILWEFDREPRKRDIIVTISGH
ncbi:MAG: YjbQ family protein [Candidatus Aenigmarchaeota archaeon]|nr:YjbQ family protein [Candidatus Aenigmarchaeota archaeon]